MSDTSARILNRMMEAAREAENTAPVTTFLEFDQHGIEMRMRLDPRKMGVREPHPWSALDRKFAWEEISDCQINPITFYMTADRQHMLAQFESKTSTNPNRERGYD